MHGNKEYSVQKCVIVQVCVCEGDDYLCIGTTNTVCNSGFFLSICVSVRVAIRCSCTNTACKKVFYFSLNLCVL